MLPEPGQITNRSDQDYESAKIGKNAGPTNRGKRTVSKADIVDKKDSDREKPRAQEKNPRETLFRTFPKRDPRLKNREHQCEVAEANDVRVSVNLRAAIFEKSSDVAEIQPDRGTVTGKSRVCSGGKAVADAGSILVEHEYGKEIAEDHASEDQPDPAEHEQPPRAERRERGEGVFRRNGLQRRGRSVGHDGLLDYLF